MKIALFDMLHWDKNNMESLLEGHELVFFDYSVQEEDLERAVGCEAICIFVSSHLSRKEIDSFPGLKLVCTMSTGFDHVDLDVCREKGITVCNVPYYGENTVAEHAFALLMSIAKKIPQAIERTKEENFSTEGLEGFDLGGKTIGVVGCGHIGMHAIKIAKGFGMEVMAFDVNKHEELARKLGFKYAALEDLAKNSDIITIHVPYNEHTHHLFNRDLFESMKPGCVLINTSRGGVIDTGALVWALGKGIVKAAGLDVLEGEELIGKKAGNPDERKLLELDEKLLEMKNVAVTPHSAFNTREALGRIEESTVENIKAFINGKPINVVKR